MEKFGWRGFFELFLGGALLLSVIFLGVRLHLTENEYRTYREGIYTRAYESSISLLGAYLTEKDPALAPLLAARLSELPLAEEEQALVRRFISEVANAPYDTAAKERSLSYTKTLLSHLSHRRSTFYGSNFRRGALALPPYPEADLPTALRPPPEEEDSLPRQTAEALLGNSLLSYDRKELLCFRSASGFAEFREGRLVRALVYREIGDAEATLATAEAAALNFLDACGYPAASLILTEARRDGGFFLFSFASEEATFTLSLTKDDARLHSFLVAPLS